MAAFITPESIANYNRGIAGDRFFGICDMGSQSIHLTIGERADGATIPSERKSKIRGIEREVLDGRGGHSTMAQWAGVRATQVAVGVVNGNAYGFMFELGASDDLTLTVRSGLCSI